PRRAGAAGAHGRRRRAGRHADVAAAPRSGRHPMTVVHIDTDPGIDDAVAIMFALRAGLDVRGITTVSGNLPAERCAVNARKVLELMGAGPIPVAAGGPTPLVRPYPRDPFSHGDDGLAGTGLPEPRRPLDPRFAPDLIVDLADEHPGELVVLALGPL